MKWSEENDEMLISLINQNKKYVEIANILNTTNGSIRNRCNRLGLHIKFQVEIKCLQCGNLFNGYKSEKRKFCSNSCSAKYGNLKRGSMLEETKQKLRDTFEKKRLLKGITNKKKCGKYKIKERNCKSCSNKITEKHKSICSSCRVNYYKFYRPSCEFNFNVKDYPNDFNFDLIDKYGLYSPRNKGDNINGVSRDHLYSVKDGFLNQVDPSIIKHPANCQLMRHVDNNIKKTKSVITFDELILKIKLWDDNH